eukprot:6488672-Amphidinium_carterae.3
MKREEAERQLIKRKREERDREEREDPHLITEENQEAIRAEMTQRATPKARPTAAPGMTTSTAASSTGQAEKKTPPTPTLPTISPRLRLDKNNFAIETPRLSDEEYEQKILQEMIRESYIKYHPTSGYKYADTEIKNYYDRFEIYNWHDENNPVQPMEPGTRPSLRQYLSISLHYASNFYDKMRLQNLAYLKGQGYDDEQINMKEAPL